MGLRLRLSTKFKRDCLNPILSNGYSTEKSSRRLVSKVKQKCVVRWSKNKSKAGGLIEIADKKKPGVGVFSDEENLKREEIAEGKKPTFFSTHQVCFFFLCFSC